MKYKDIQKEELKTWNIEDEKTRRDKQIREFIRYPLMKKQMGLDWLDTSWMEVWDIGCGATGGVTKVLNAKRKLYIDPLADSYKDYYDTTHFVTAKAEDLEEKLSIPDLVVVSNALDHFEKPALFLVNLVKHMKPGGYFTHLHAINNAITHKHPAHEHNVNPEFLHHYLGDDFEMCWYMDFKQDGLTYGWKKQPAFSGLYRKVTGYGK